MTTVGARSRVWLISGASSGLGRSLATAALAQGDSVIATSRHPDMLQDLRQRYSGRFLAIEVDLAYDGSVAAAVAEGVAAFGRLDVLVCNAGYGLIGAVEELPEDLWYEQFEINVHGVIRLVRHCTPFLRRANAADILIISSSGCYLRTPAAAAYQASKHALAGLVDGLSAELRPRGIRVRLVVPGPFRTEFVAGLKFHEPPGSAYSVTINSIREAMSEMNGAQQGDPDRAATVLIAAVEGGERTDDAIVFLGSAAIREAEQRLRADLADLEAARELAIQADFVS